MPKMARPDELATFQMYKCYPDKFKLLLTLGCYFVFINFGITCILPSLALIDLTYLMDTSIVTSSFGLTLGTSTCFVGCLLCGLVFKRIDRRVGLIWSMVINSLITILIPFLTSITPFMVLMFFWGLVAAVIDVNINAWILDLWGDQCNSYMQGLHFCFGLGMALAPLFIAPFMGLEPKNGTNLTHPITDGPLGIGEHFAPGKPVETFKLIFVLLGLGTLVSALIQVVLLVMENRLISTLKPTFRKDANENDSPVASKRSNSPSTKFIVTLGFFTVLFHIGMEVNSIRFVTEYIHFLGYDVTTAGHRATIMNSAYAFFRFIGIFVPRFVATDIMILAHLSLVMLSAFILVFLTHVSLTWITIGLFLFGAGCSVIFPSIYALVEERTHLSNFAVGLFTAAGLIPGILYPIAMPIIMERYPMVFVYNILVSIVLVTICVLWLIEKVPKSAVN